MVKSNSTNDKPNILVIVMDATRADHLSCYGYSRNTSPQIDRMAARGVVYEQAIAAANWTLPSMASIFTGLYVTQHGTGYHHQYLEPEFKTLAEVLRGQGYQTALFSAGGWVSETFGMNRGFDVLHDYLEGARWYRRLLGGKATRAEKLLRRGRYLLMGGVWGKMTHEISKDLRQWIKACDTDRPFFAVTHFGDPHWPWFSHPRHSWLKAGQKAPRLYAPDDSKFMAGEEDLAAGDYQMISDLYDGEVSFLDSYLGKIFDWLEARGSLENTLVVITADHGEHLGDHRLVGHKLSVYESLLHVPLVLAHPRYFHGGVRVNEPVQTTELFSTVLDLIGIEKQSIPQAVTGRSLIPEKVAAAPRPYCLSENISPNLQRFRRVTPDFDISPLQRDLRALRDNKSGYKLIWSSDGRHELYNLVQDPDEKVNLASTEPRRLESMIAELEQLLDVFGKIQLDRLEPEMDEAVAERLQDLGYL